VILYLVDQPHIYDIFRVKVATVVHPSSPVHLHLGAQVTFQLVTQNQNTRQDYLDNLIWTSSNPSVLNLDPKSAKGLALSEGTSDILLSNHINTASLVHVHRIQHAEIEFS
jgi:hypothetical protein